MWYGRWSQLILIRYPDFCCYSCIGTGCSTKKSGGPYSKRMASLSSPAGHMVCGMVHPGSVGVLRCYMDVPT